MAQLVEQMTVNHWVTGSSPVIPANYFYGASFIENIMFYYMRE